MKKKSLKTNSALALSAEKPHLPSRAFARVLRLSIMIGALLLLFLQFGTPVAHGDNFNANAVVSGIEARDHEQLARFAVAQRVKDARDVVGVSEAFRERRVAGARDAPNAELVEAAGSA